jgi:H+-translocating NAD(P) transhydrogenase subunit alpha
LLRDNETYVDEESGVTVCGITSFVSTMPGQASELYSNNMFNLLEELCKIPKNKDNNAAQCGIDLTDEVADGAVVIANKVLRWIPYAERVKLEEKKRKEMAERPEAKRHEEKQPERKKEKAGKPEGKLVSEPLSEKLIERREHEEQEAGASMNVGTSGIVVMSMTLLAIGLAYSTNYAFMMNFLIFTLALVIGYIVVWGVDPLLHASLMSETNAISGIIYIGSMLQLYGFDGSFTVANTCGFMALFFASINVFGGFVLTDRMLRMISC